MSVTLTPATTAPVGSVTLPKIRPPVLWAISNVEEQRQTNATRIRFATHDRIGPPKGGEVFRYLFSRNRSACVQNKPCYNRARLEKLPQTVKRKIPISHSCETIENRVRWHEAGRRQTLLENR